MYGCTSIFWYACPEFHDIPLFFSRSSVKHQFMSERYERWNPGSKVRLKKSANFGWKGIVSDLRANVPSPIPVKWSNFRKSVNFIVIAPKAGPASRAKPAVFSMKLIPASTSCWGAVNSQLIANFLTSLLTKRWKKAFKRWAFLPPFYQMLRFLRIRDVVVELLLVSSDLELLLFMLLSPSFCWSSCCFSICCRF